MYLDSLSIYNNTVYEPWLNDANASVTMNGSTDTVTYAGALCTPPGYIFVCESFGLEPSLWFCVKMVLLCCFKFCSAYLLSFLPPVCWTLVKMMCLMR